MATGLLTALEAHAALEPTDTTMYDIDEIPTASDAKYNLPCVVPLLGEIGGDPALDVLSSGGGHADLTFEIGFLLLSLESNEERPQQVPKIAIEHFDAYFDALLDNMDLDDSLSDDLILKAEFGIWTWMGEQWVGTKLTHTWEFLVDG